MTDNVHRILRKVNTTHTTHKILWNEDTYILKVFSRKDKALSQLKAFLCPKLIWAATANRPQIWLWPNSWHRYLRQTVFLSFAEDVFHPATDDNLTISKKVWINFSKFSIGRYLFPDSNLYYSFMGKPVTTRPLIDGQMCENKCHRQSIFITTAVVI